jgi:anaerobic selenocysteine-containing dehydrogenase
MNSVGYGEREAEPVIRLHPDDAANRGTVRVSSAHGAMTATVRADPAVRSGTVSVNHGRADANVGALTSATVDVDPLTGMPMATGVPVELRRDELD